MNYKWFNWLNQMKKLYDMMLSPLSSDTRINRNELDILLFLNNNSDLNIAADIVDKRGIAKAYVSTSLKNLMEEGYITKYQKEDNKKEFLISLTKKTHPLIKEGLKIQKEFYEVLY